MVEMWNNPVGASALTGSKLESVLRYGRPLVEDGVVDYEFYYEPGKAVVHPVLGRLAFLINPDGVSLHRLTDTPYERGGLDTGNIAVEPNRRRGPASLPLRPKAWNRLKLGIKGESLTIVLNDELIYERPIESTNSKTFGLFHFADESEARVRNLTYQGQWSRDLPPSVVMKRE